MEEMLQAKTAELELQTVELREANEALRKIEDDLERAQMVGHIGSWRLDVSSNVLKWSAENHRIFGIPEDTPLSYKVFLDAVHPDDREYVDKIWQGVLNEEHGVYNIEHRIVADGEVKWVRERAELEYDPNGEVTGGFGTTQDITESKLIEEKISQMRREQEAFMRHEVKNLFTPLHLNAQTLLLSNHGNLTEKQVRQLNRIKESAEQITCFIDNLKHMHDIEKGHCNLHVVNQSLDEIIIRTLTDIKPIAVPHGVTFSYSKPEHPQSIPIDPDLFPGVLFNLIKNAVEHVARLHAPEDKRVRIESCERDGVSVLKITNRGASIPPERLATFFDKFNVGPEKSSGTGLGTTYAYLIVRAHGGNIWVSSNDDEGTTVTVELPSR